jgi:hypothetical protein
MADGQGLTFGKIVKGALTIAGATLAIAVVGDNIDGMFDGITENSDHWTDKVGDAFSWAGEKAAIGVDKVTEIAGVANDAYNVDSLQNTGFGEKVGVWDAIKDVSSNGWDKAKAGFDVAMDHKALTATAAVVGGVGTLAATNRGKHTARINAERGQGTIATVASNTGGAIRRAGYVGRGVVNAASDLTSGVQKAIS